MPDSTESTDRLGLVELIRSLRAELWAAAREGGSEQLKFEVGPIDLELQVAVTKAGKGDVGVKFWVFTASGGGSYESANMQRLHLQLTPLSADGTNFKVSDSGAALPTQGEADSPNQESGGSG